MHAPVLSGSSVGNPSPLVATSLSTMGFPKKTPPLETFVARFRGLRLSALGRDCTEIGRQVHEIVLAGGLPWRRRIQ
jgi:hypothetical protein